jgi:hypothetical protein
MSPAEFPVERTAVGLQYVIPGAERQLPRVTDRTKYAVEGEQLVIPGADPVPAKELYSRLALKPLRPRRAQVSLHGTTLFAPAKSGL